MELHNPTTSRVIAYLENLETHSAEFYQKLADRLIEHSALFSAFVRESKLNRVMISRTYQETVTDALETTFSFEGLDLGTAIPEDIWNNKPDPIQALEGSMRLERAASELYTNIANLSMAHLSTIARAFEIVAGRRKSRVSVIESLRTQI